jgi:DNA-binding response OmpR family regulator
MHAPFVLLVEDDVMLRTILARNLEVRGYLVLQAGTVREARDQLVVKPRLLVLDIGLPDAPGWEVARWLETISKPVPIVVISGNRLEAEPRRRFQPVAFLPKPFTIQAFLAVVEEHLLPSTGAPGDH